MKDYKFKINGNEYAVMVNSVEENQANVSVNGTDYNVEVAGMTTPQPKTPKLVQTPTVPSTDVHPAVAKTAKPAGPGATAIKSPLPGVILEMNVREGDHIKVGQRLLVLEAMKMENNIDSDKEGVVRSLKVHKGDSVLEGDVLLTIE